MFRATMCPSSGEITVSMRHLVFVTPCGWLFGMQSGMNVERRNKYTKKNCAPSWLYLQDYTRLHGEQNIKRCVCLVMPGDELFVIVLWFLVSGKWRRWCPCSAWYRRAFSRRIQQSWWTNVLERIVFISLETLRKEMSKLFPRVNKCISFWVRSRDILFSRNRTCGYLNLISKALLVFWYNYVIASLVQVLLNL